MFAPLIADLVAARRQDEADVGERVSHEPEGHAVLPCGLVVRSLPHVEAGGEPQRGRVGHSAEQPRVEAEHLADAHSAAPEVGVVLASGFELGDSLMEMDHLVGHDDR